MVGFGKALPQRFYNIAKDIDIPPLLDPATREPVEPSDMEKVFPAGFVEQEFSRERFLPIPDEVRELYATYRPTTLRRCPRFEQAIGAKAEIYVKNEGESHTGAHKLNSALMQAYFAREEGTREITTETGAGQWGTAVSLACALFGLQATVFMTRCTHDQKPMRPAFIRLYGGEVHPSPSRLTESGRAYPEDHSGTLGIAISEAMEYAVARGAKYVLGSVLNAVLAHQTVIGQEARKQLPRPDVVVGCVGGGSNFAGLAFPYMRDEFRSRTDRRYIAVEPTTCQSLGEGEYRYDSGDTAGLTPLLRMFTLGSDFMPPPIYTGGLRYHGVAPAVSALYQQGLIEQQSVQEKEAFEFGRLFARTEGILPAPESAHAVAAAAREARLPENEGKKVLFNLSGHGLLSLPAYGEVLR